MEGMQPVCRRRAGARSIRHSSPGSSTRAVAIAILAFCSWSVLGGSSAFAAPCEDSAKEASFQVISPSGGIGSLPPLLAWGRSIKIDATIHSWYPTSTSLLINGTVVDTAAADPENTSYGNDPSATVTMPQGAAGVTLSVVQTVREGYDDDMDVPTCEEVSPPVTLAGGRGKPIRWSYTLGDTWSGRQLEIAPQRSFDESGCAQFARSPVTVRVAAGGLTRSITVADQCAMPGTAHCKIVATRFFQLAWSPVAYEEGFVVAGVKRPATVTMTTVGKSRTWHIKPGARSASTDSSPHRCS